MKKYFGLVAALCVLVLLSLALPVTTPAEKVVTRSQSENIRLIDPQPNQKIDNPVLITGEARVFENAFNYRLLDGTGGQIAGGFAFARAEDAGLYGPFSVKLMYQKPTTATGTIELYTHSLENGEEIDMVSIPVRF
jgi:hypothetical protein